MTRLTVAFSVLRMCLKTSYCTWFERDILCIILIQTSES